MEPNEIEGRQFGSTLRGYDRQEVEDFAREVAEYVRHLTKKLAGVEAALEAARSAPPPPPSPQVSTPAAQPKAATSQPEKADVYKQLGEETARILISAEQAGNQIKEEAKREAAEVLADARREAGRIARQAREGRQKAEGDLRQFLQARGMLAGQLEDVRRRLAEAVARLQAPLDPAESPAAKPVPAAGVLPSPPGPAKEIEASDSGVPASQPSPPGTTKGGEAASSPAARLSGPPEQHLEPAVKKPQQQLTEEEPPAPERAAAQIAKEPALRSVSASSKQPTPDQHRVGRMIESTQFPPPRLVPPTREVPKGDDTRRVASDSPSSPGRIPNLSEPPDGVTGIQKAAELKPDAEEAPATSANGAKRKTEPSRDIVEQLLEEIREDSKMDSGDLPRQISSDPKLPAAIPATMAEAGTKPAQPVLPKDASFETARKLKRLFQEVHNDLLHRLRSQRGRGTLDENMAPEDEQMDRFQTALRPGLQKAFVQGRRAANGAGEGAPDAFLFNLVAEQVVSPLRSELRRVVGAGLEAKDTPTAISERAGDVFRIWKGVRTELLGDGLVSAAFHEGLLGVWRADPAKGKRWVLSPEEQDCPKGVCRANAAQGLVPAGSAFASGHAGPPAHGGCTCGLESS